MKDRAFAKINLSLDVVKKRDDGYHELEMIMIPIEFYDIVEINCHEKMEFTSNSKYLPHTTEGNTVLKAIQEIKKRYQISQNFSVNVTKHIPTRAGLGGGSADAAAAIRILDKLLHLQLTLSEKIDIAKSVGADVPFCIANKSALVKGIGENLEYIDVKEKFFILLVKPKKGISTKIAFQKLDFTKCDHPNCEQIKTYLETGNYEELSLSLKNSLEQPSIAMVNEISHFGITKNQQILDEGTKIMLEKKYFVRKTKILSKK